MGSSRRELGDLLARVSELVAKQRAEFETGPVHASATLDELRTALGGPTPETATASETVVTDLAARAAPGLLGIPGPRYFGFVIGGSHPAALAADWLTSGWDNNAGLYAAAPAAAVIEEIAGRWLLDLLGLPTQSSVGFVTGGMMANFTALAAARHRVLADVGWDVAAHGLHGAPRVRVVVGEERHATIDIALRYLGFGDATAERVPADEQGRMRADALGDLLATGDDAPLIVCAQAGNVNSGAFDPIDEICAAAHARNGWVHVDGAFGLWAAVTEDRRVLVRGVEAADSWATDAHKWLNVPYDCGIVVVPRPRVAPRGDGDRSQLPRPGRRGRAVRAVRVGAGILATRPRHPRVCRHSRAGPRRHRVPDLAELRDGAPIRRSALGRTRDRRAQRRRAEPGARALRRVRRPHPRCHRWRAT